MRELLIVQPHRSHVGSVRAINRGDLNKCEVKPSKEECQVGTKVKSSDAHLEALLDVGKTSDANPSMSRK